MRKNNFYYTFNLRLSKKDKKYFKVLIFRNLIAMRMFYSEQCKLSGIKYDEDFRAMCQPFEIIRITKDGKEERLNKIGNILLFREDMGSGLVAHELGHATFHYWNILKNKKEVKNMEEEEEFLYYLGNMKNITLSLNLKNGRIEALLT